MPTLRSPKADGTASRTSTATIARLVPTVLDNRLRHFAAVKDAAGCRATAEKWEALHRTDAESLYALAAARAVTAAVIRATDKFDTAADQANAEADRAMTWLRKAIAAGYADAENVAKDADLNALRDREDFMKLLAGLTAKRQDGKK